MPSYQPRSVWGPFSTIINVLTFGVGVGLFLTAIFLPLALIGGGGAQLQDDVEGTV